ncbi:MAG: hypothetical protein AAF993_02045 [Pseudomonadota bacterium]
MKLFYKLTRRLACALCFVLPVAFLFGVSAQAQEAAPPAVVETFTCSYNPGQDEDDLMSARDYYVKQAEKAGVTLGPAYTWSLLKGDVNFDFVWLAPHQNFSAFAAAFDAEAGASALADVPARFDAVADCRAGLGTIHALHVEEGASASPSFITSNACRLHEGMGAEQMRDLGGHISAVMAELGDAAPQATYAIAPTTRGPNMPDMVIFSVNESATSYAEFVAQLYGTDAGQRLIRHFNMLGNCGNAMWAGQQVIEGPPAE